MTITEFAESRGIPMQNVSSYINRHKDDFAGHTKRVGKSVELDDAAFEILEKQYPLPKPIEIVEDTESMKKLIEAQELIMRLQIEITRLTEESVKNKASQLLLEDRERQLEEQKLLLTDALASNQALQDKVEAAVEAKHQAELQNAKTQQEKEQLEAELGKYQKSIFGFYRKKD